MTVKIAFVSALFLAGVAGRAAAQAVKCGAPDSEMTVGLLSFANNLLTNPRFATNRRNMGLPTLAPGQITVV